MRNQNQCTKPSRNASKRGVTSLEMIAIFVIFMSMFGFFLDMFTMLNQHYVVAREVNVVTRQLAVQGGVSPRAPADNFNRFAKTYGTGQDIHLRLRENLGGVGITNYHVYIKPQTGSATVNGVELKPATTLAIPYQDNFELQLTYDYEWKLMGQLIPGMGGTRTRTVQRSAVSETGGK